MKNNYSLGSSFAFMSTLFILLFAACSENEDTSTDSHKKLTPLALLDGSETGIKFNNILNDDPEGTRNVLSFPHYYNGAGVGMGDFDNDGLVDIFFSGNEVPNAIYKNLGDLKFEDKSSTAGINVNKIWSSGVSVVDINNDGFLDIYVSQCGPSEDPDQMKNLFYINQGDFTFVESAQKMGLADGNIGTQAAFFDMDKDGDLDVYLLNESKYVMVSLATVFKDLENEENLRAASGKMYRNNGDNTFTDITKEAGMLEQAYGLGIMVSDFNNDNYPDVYVANDYSVPDRMYINQKNGTFKDQIKTRTDNISYFSMGCDVADINNDGLQDMAVVDMATADHFRGKTLMASMDSEAFNYYVYKLGYQFQYMFNAVQLNNGDGTFSNIAGITGLQKTDWSWAALFVDMNLDGYKDYYVSNGFKKYARDNDFRIEMEKLRNKNGGTVPISMRKEVYAKMPTIELRNLLYMNNGDLHFEENPAEYNYPDVGTFSYGAAYADLDNDGDLEMIVNNIDKQAHILKNNTRENKTANYLTIKLDADMPSKTLNSTVTIFYGDEVQVAENYFIRGYLSSMDQRVFFGLGKVKKIDKLEVKWSDGKMQTLKNVQVNQQLNISYNPNSSNPTIPERRSSKITQVEQVESSKIGLNYVHKENDFEDFAKEVLLPQKQSTMGPGIAVGDVNGDGLDDLYCGGAASQSGEFYLQNTNGNFTKSDDLFFQKDINMEDLDAIFVDPNKDGIKEMIIASGGGGDFEGKGVLLQDRFFVFIDGMYKKTGGVLPTSERATYKIKAQDLDNDGIQEIFVLGAAKPGKYPLSEQNALLKYSGNKYNDVSSTLSPEFAAISLARDVEFSDFNGDGLMDFIVVSEWGTPRIFISYNGTFSDQTSTYLKNEKHGWWNSITKFDIDNDGDDDFIVGNMGENIKHHVSEKKPLYLYANDFDKNGTLDVVLAKEYKGKIVPARGKECSTEQMPFISQKFESYKDFASSDIVGILGKKSVDESKKFKTTSFGSFVLRNNNGVFEYEKLPSYAQIAPIYESIAVDLNKDGFMDIIAVGNNYNTEYETPRQDAGRGVVLMNNAGKGFTALAPYESGLYLDGNFRRVKLLKRKNDQLLIAGENNGPLQIYKLPL